MAGSATLRPLGTPLSSGKEPVGAKKKITQEPLPHLLETNLAGCKLPFCGELELATSFFLFWFLVAKTHFLLFI